MREVCGDGCRVRCIVITYIRGLILILVLAGNAWKDVREQKISLPLTLASFPPALFCAYLSRDDFPVGLLYSLFPGCISFMLTRLTGGQIGAGDGIILCLIGVMYPAEDVSVILMAALFLAAAYSGILLVRRHRKEESYAFVPFLFAGTVLVAVTGRMAVP